MSRQFRLAIVLAGVALLVVGGCGSREPEKKVEEKVEEKVAPVVKEVKPGKLASERGGLAREPMGHLASGPNAKKEVKIPQELEGTWQKAEHPLRGILIDFTVVEGMVSARISRGPDVGKEVEAFYLEKNKGIQGKADKLTECLAKTWVPGTIMFIDVVKKDDTNFYAKRQKKFMVHDPCNEVRGSFVEVTLVLTDPDTFESRMPIKGKTEPVVEVWKRARSQEAAAEEK